MKGIVLALALHSAVAGSGSLGIGIDVLPEAFSFAASRVGYAPSVQLAQCYGSVCRWRLGARVALVASLSRVELDVSSVEIELEPSASHEDTAQFRRACLAIVALFDSGETEAERRSIANAIATVPASVPEVAIEDYDRGAHFYGAPGRCGAAALSTGGP